jgi:predicted nucleic acid-binding protein
MTRLADALTGVARLGLDTAPIIYFIEAHPQYDAATSALFQLIADGAITGVTSVISLLEVLVQPLRQGNTQLQQQYQDLLLHSTNFQTVPVSAEVAGLGAELRARYQLRTPDALQIAAALNAGCTAFVTNDIALRRVMELRVLVLDELALEDGPAPGDNASGEADVTREQEGL